MIKRTEIKLELISDIDLYLFIEKGIKGCISYIAKRYSKASNKYMKCYDSSKECKFIMSLNANDLYGCAMSRNLYYNGFKWLNWEEIDKFDENAIDKNSPVGHIPNILMNYMICLIVIH